MSLRERLARALGWEPIPPRATAIKLERGGVYAIECAEPLDKITLQDIQAYLDSFKKRTGCEFLILDAGLSLATALSRDEP